MFAHGVSGSTSAEVSLTYVRLLATCAGQSNCGCANSQQRDSCDNHASGFDTGARQWLAVTAVC